MPFIRFIELIKMIAPRTSLMWVCVAACVLILGWFAYCYWWWSWWPVCCCVRRWWTIVRNWCQWDLIRRWRCCSLRWRWWAIVPVCRLHWWPDCRWQMLTFAPDRCYLSSLAHSVWRPHCCSSVSSASMGSSFPGTWTRPMCQCWPLAWPHSNRAYLFSLIALWLRLLPHLWYHPKRCYRSSIASLHQSPASHHSCCKQLNPSRLFRRPHPAWYGKNKRISIGIPSENILILTALSFSLSLSFFLNPGNGTLCVFNISLLDRTKLFRMPNGSLLLPPPPPPLSDSSVMLINWLTLLVAPSSPAWIGISSAQVQRERRETIP